MDRDAPGAGVPLPEHADGVGITGRPKQYVLTNPAFLRTMADLLAVVLTTVGDFVHSATFLFRPCPCLQCFFFSSRVSFFNTSLFILSGMQSAEVHEDVREAANNLVKYFHKPEQEVRGCDAQTAT